VLGCALGYVGFLSAEAFGFQQAFGLSEVDALARLGIDAASWQLQRALLAVFLVALSGFTRYHPQRKTVADERAALERELELEPLRQQVRATRVTGVATLARTTLLAARGGSADPRPPTGPGSPTAAPEASSESAEATQPPARLRGVTRPQQAAASGRKNRRSRRGVRSVDTRTASAEPKIRAVYQSGMSVRDLAAAAGVSSSAASKWRKVLLAEATQLVAQ